MKERIDSLTGHAWTILPTVRSRLAPRSMPRSRPWLTAITDPVAGDVVVRGEYSERESDTLLIALHGLGGTPDSAYLQPIASAADDRGWSSLRLALRGSDGIGNDLYHAGLIDDAIVALSHETFARYDRVFVIGFSLGGHITLRLASEESVDPRVAAVAAVCPPIDLDAGVRAIDEASPFFYRDYVVRELKAMYRTLARKCELPTPWSRVRLAKTVREWDALTVVPRFGFGDVDEYYRSQGVGPRLAELSVPALMVHSPHDPMIPPETVRPHLERASDLFDARWVEGAGHVYFPPGLDLGVDAPRGLAAQVLGWLEDAA